MSRRFRTTAAVRRSAAGFSDINLGENRPTRPDFLVLFDVQARGGTTSPSSRLKGRRATGWFLVISFWFLVDRLTRSERTRNKEPETRNQTLLVNFCWFRQER